MTDQMPKLAIGNKLLFPPLTWKDVNGEAFFQPSLSGLTGGRGFTTRKTKIILFYLTFASVTVCHWMFCVFPEILHPYIKYPPPSPGYLVSS